MRLMDWNGSISSYCWSLHSTVIACKASIFPASRRRTSAPSTSPYPTTWNKRCWPSASSRHVTSWHVTSVEPPIHSADSVYSRTGRASSRVASIRRRWTRSSRRSSSSTFQRLNFPRGPWRSSCSTTTNSPTTSASDRSSFRWNSSIRLKREIIGRAFPPTKRKRRYTTENVHLDSFSLTATRLLLSKL